MYLWHLLTRSENELIKKIYQTQKLKSTKGDWVNMIQTEKSKYDISLTDEEISKLSKYKFKTIVDKKVNLAAFQYLKSKAVLHSKSSKILQEIKSTKTLVRRPYLKEGSLSKSDSQLLFKLRSRMLDVKTNFKTLYNNDLNCRTCQKENKIENENHILNCEALEDEVRDSQKVDFDFVFKDLKHQMIAVRAFKTVLRKRELILNLFLSNS